MNSRWFTLDEAAGLRLFFGFEADLAAEALEEFA